jgi:AraC-like DNA-binding protein
MPGSHASVFGEAENFQAALSADGMAELLVTSPGHFRARLTQIGLERLRLAAVEESQSRIAFIAVPPGMVLIAFAIEKGPSPVWAGIEVRAGEIIAFGPGERLHARTVGPCHWGAIWVPDRQLADYGLALSHTAFVVPPTARWFPSRAAVKELHDLHRAAIRMAEARGGAVTDPQAVHGLEHQLLDALIECLSAPGEKEAGRHRATLARFEDLLNAEPLPRMAAICAALGVSDRLLSECCNKHLGIGPIRYSHLRAMQQVRRALSGGTPDETSISEVARRYGFHALGRLAANYRTVYGELPSATLRRRSLGMAVRAAPPRHR